MNATEFKELPNWEKVRTLSGMFTQDVGDMSNRLAIICLISRVEVGDANVEFLNSVIDKAFGE
jgi:hypothetical protein